MTFYLVNTTFKSRNNDFLSHNNDFSSRYNDFLSRYNDFLSHNNDFLLFFLTFQFDLTRLSYIFSMLLFLNLDNGAAPNHGRIY